MSSNNMAYYKKKYELKNPKKYLGNPHKIIARSSWETKCMNHFDTSSHVLAWSSEEIKIPYLSPKDGRFHRYFPDFLIVTLDKDKNKVVTVIEVKPDKEQFPPKKQGKKKARYLQECMTYEVNMSKWKYAREYCNKRGWKFIVMTEKHIFPKQNK